MFACNLEDCNEFLNVPETCAVRFSPYQPHKVVSLISCDHRESTVPDCHDIIANEMVDVTSAIHFVRAKRSALVISHSGQFTSSTLLIIPKLFHYSFTDAAIQFLQKLLALPDEACGQTKSFNAERFLQKINHFPIRFRITNRNLYLEGFNEP